MVAATRLPGGFVKYPASQTRIYNFKQIFAFLLNTQTYRTSAAIGLGQPQLEPSRTGNTAQSVRTQSPSMNLLDSSAATQVPADCLRRCHCRPNRRCGCMDRSQKTDQSQPELLVGDVCRCRSRVQSKRAKATQRTSAQFRWPAASRRRMLMP